MERGRPDRASVAPSRRAVSRRARIEAALWRLWTSRGFGQALLFPVAQLYAAIARWRRARGRAEAAGLFVPVRAVVGIGNLTVGGSGKTPATLWLATRLQRELAPRGLRVGILSRGYGRLDESRTRGSRRASPDADSLAGCWVQADSDPGLVGDEPVLLARRTGLPVRVDRDRVRGLRALARAGVDVVVADDALQHHRLPLDLRVLLVHGVRRFGNGLTLPAGPLREPIEGAGPFDAVLTVYAPHDVPPAQCTTDKAADRFANVAVDVCDERIRAPIESVARVVMASHWLAVDGGVRQPKAFAAAAPPPGSQVHAVAGIADPERFFASVERLGWTVQRHPFPDHHRYTLDDLDFDDERPVVMTEKDAVKIAYLLSQAGTRRVSRGGWWFWPMTLEIDRSVFDQLLARLDARMRLHEAPALDRVRDWRSKGLPARDALH